MEMAQLNLEILTNLIAYSLNTVIGLCEFHFGSVLFNNAQNLV